MTTSDDEPMFAPHADEPGSTTHADPLAAPTLAAAEPARWPLAILAALGVMVAGLALWVFIAMQFNRPMAIVAIAFGVGWVLRVVSRRSTIAVRVLAVVLTAIAAVIGTVIGTAAPEENRFGASLTEAFNELLPKAFDLVADLPAATLAIYGVSLVLAWLSASPPKDKAGRATINFPPATPAATATDSDDELPPTDSRPAAG